MTAKTPRPVMLCILDGWGHRDDSENNAIAIAKTPTWDRMVYENPNARIRTSGLDVGLPDGQMGNSEVGHMNIGGGRVVMQDLPRIDKAVEDNALGGLSAMSVFTEKMKAAGGTAHLMALISPGGVHSHQDHIIALSRVLDTAGVPVRIHAILDGRDTPPKSAKAFVAAFEDSLSMMQDAKIATICGRYYAMDRDQNWDRNILAYDLMVDGKGAEATSAQAAITASWTADVTDEFVMPVAVGDYAGMKDGDGLLCGNFRADRVRQILTMLVDPAFDGCALPRRVDFTAQAGLVEYSVALNAFLPALFPAEEVNNSLGEVVAKAGLTQLRIAETEKYPHVTYFLNGGSEDVFTGEDRILVPSPKVATYDLQPEMSAPEVCDKLVAAIEAGSHDLIIVNFANGDMVGHTGKLDAAVKAAECIDTVLARLEIALEKAGGVMLVTADHGNAELMVDPETGNPHTAHTTFPVPLVLAGAGVDDMKLQDGRLADLAPTALDLMGLAIPADMTGTILVSGHHPVQSAAE